MFWKRILTFGVFCMVTALLLTAVMGNTDLSSFILEETDMSQGKSLHREYDSGESYYMVDTDEEGTASLVLVNDRVATKLKILEKREGKEKQSYPVFLEENEESLDIILEVSSVDVIELPSNLIDPNDPFIADEEIGDIRNFESYEDLRSYLENHTYKPVYYTKNSYRNTSGTVAISLGVSSLDVVEVKDSSGGSVSKDHSSTNIQVAGVDEGDIIKNDGNYAYIISRDDNNKYTVIIVDVFPAEEAHITSQIKVNGTISEIYITENRLVIIGTDYTRGVFVHVFDITNKEEPDLLNSYESEGSVTHSRRIGDYLYLITSQYINSGMQEEDLPVSPESIYYFPESDEDNNRYYGLPLTTIISINIANTEEEPNSRSIFNRYTGNIYVSTGNIYITYGDYQDGQKTVIHRISINEGEIRYRAMGSVPGYALNRFSMGEHRGFFRIATSGGSLSKSGQGTATNQVYVLDMDMNTVGKVEDIAPGERIYSARFMGDRAYLVTFKKVDPFFVIDLKKPIQSNDPGRAQDTRILGLPAPL